MWINTDYGVNDIAAARGYGGQDSFVLEDLEMSVTFTGNINHPADMSQDVAKLMKSYIIPAHDGPGEVVTALGSSCATSTLSNHVSAGRATEDGSHFFAAGSRYYLGNNISTVITLYQYQAGSWVPPSYGECS